MHIMNGIWIGALLALTSCHKGGGLAPAPPAQDSGFAQYGTPFAEVPAPDNAVLYEVNFRSFSTGGDFAGVTARLDSIRALGVNVLYLMPTYPIGVLKSINSPYCVKDYQGVNPEFGGLDDLRNLVAQAHSRHMAVLFDWVADHTSWDNAWIANKSWYLQDGSGNIISPPNTGWTDVAGLNYASQDMRRAMIRAMQYWIYTADIDGYRCDAADYVPADFWQQAIDSLHNIPGHTLLLFAEGSRAVNFQAGFQLQYDMGFYYALKNQIFAGGRSVKTLDSLDATLTGRVVRYTTNHDVDLSDGTPLQIYGGSAGSIAAFAVALFRAGTPMLYNGQEIGCPVQLQYFNHTTPIAWSAADFGMEGAYRTLLALWNGSAVLRNGTFTSYDSDDVCAFTKASDGSTVLVLVNLRSSPRTFSVPGALSGAWTDAVNGGNVPLSGTLSLEGYGYRVMTR
jgi:glycosidase